MHVRVAVAAVQKGGNTPDEYEDACFPPAPYETEAWYFRAAVADGATETSFSGEWAQILVRGFCGRRVDIRRWLEILPGLRRRWQARVSNKALAWYAQEKLQWGAFSSLLGLTILDGSLTTPTFSGTSVVDATSSPTDAPAAGGSWWALAAGDSCLFHIRSGAILNAFPLERSESFHSRPALISSLPASTGSPESPFTPIEGHWRSGDQFLLATDTLARWLLATNEGGDDGLEHLQHALGDPRTFPTWVEALRNEGRIRNDDVSALTVDVGASEQVSSVMQPLSRRGRARRYKP